MSTKSIHNRKASFNYTFIERYEAGIQLLGTEVKAVRAGHINLSEAYCYFDNTELFAKMSIQNMPNMPLHDTERPKKILLNRKELDQLSADLIKGYTIVVSKILFVNGLIKAELMLAKGKKIYDKRESIKNKDAEREIRSLS
jgi:SsrA-binding protein